MGDKKTGIVKVFAKREGNIWALVFCS